MAISEERLRELAEKMAAIMQRVESEHTSAAPTPSNVVRLVPRAAVPREPLPLDAIAQSTSEPVNTTIEVSPGYENEKPSWRVERCLAQAITMLSVIYGNGKESFSAWSDEERDTYLWTVHDKVVEARCAFEQVA